MPSLGISNVRSAMASTSVFLKLHQGEVSNAFLRWRIETAVFGGGGGSDSSMADLRLRLNTRSHHDNDEGSLVSYNDFSSCTARYGHKRVAIYGVENPH